RAARRNSASLSRQKVIWREVRTAQASKHAPITKLQIPSSQLEGSVQHEAGIEFTELPACLMLAISLETASWRLALFLRSSSLSPQTIIMKTPMSGTYV